MLVGSAYHCRVQPATDTRNPGTPVVARVALDASAEAWPLARGEVQVWRASLERPAATVERMRGVLAADERERADRFRFERHRARYTVGRALLRYMLARYVDSSPRDLELQYGEFGKPELPGGPSFNLSHSHASALYAFGASGEIGVDIEVYDPGFAGGRVAERFFSPAEVSVLRSLSAELQPRAFLECWTRKEAFIKARGDGLSLALDSFDVTLAPDVPAALVRTAWSEEEPARWQLEDLSDRQAGYVAAVAVGGGRCTVLEREIVDTTKGNVPGQERE